MNHEQQLAHELKQAAHSYHEKAQTMDLTDSVMAKLRASDTDRRDPLWPLALAAGIVVASLLPLTQKTPLRSNDMPMLQDWQTAKWNINLQDPAHLLRKEEKALASDLEKLKNMLMPMA